MFTIIHGSHRHGYHWKVVGVLRNCLERLEINVQIIDLSNLKFECCCGNQVCQDDECIYKGDELSEIFDKYIIQSEGIYIVTPTYFNMPPGKLKNLIDRSNALLPVLEDKIEHPIFGTWISGEADLESIECNRKLLADYAEIMGWKLIDEICEKVLLGQDIEVNEDKVRKYAELINNILKSSKEKG